MMLRCRLLGHEWEHLTGAVPEDRQTFRCSRCGTWGYSPARVGETEVQPDR